MPALNIGVKGEETQMATSLRLGPGDKVLVVGVKESNFHNWLKNKPSDWHKRIVFWGSTSTIGKRSEREQGIPAGVKALFFTKFVSHSEFGKIAKLAKNLGIHFTRQVQGVGEIKRLLEEMMFVGAGVQEVWVENAAPVVDLEFSEQTSKQKEAVLPQESLKMSIADFVLANADFSAEPGVKEIKRLFDMAQEQGFPAKLNSIRFQYYQLKRSHAEPADLALKKRFSRPAKKTRKRLERESAEVIEEFLASIDLVGVAVKELIQAKQLLEAQASALAVENGRLAAENKRLKKDLKAKVKGLLSQI